MNDTLCLTHYITFLRFWLVHPTFSYKKHRGLSLKLWPVGEAAAYCWGAARTGAPEPGATRAICTPHLSESPNLHPPPPPFPDSVLAC